MRTPLICLMMGLLSGVVTAEQRGFRDIYPQVKPGIVLLVSDLGQHRAGTGTGFVVASNSKYSLILTNAHVVKGAKRLNAIVGNSRPVPAKVLARDTRHDLALCKIAAGNLPILRFGRRASVEGTEVAVVGYPFTARFQGAGMEITATVTRGIISAHRKVKGAKEEVYQLDADVNPGNSGGPVFDWETGLVVGVTVFKMKNAAGLNFAVPEKLAIKFLKQQKVQPLLGGTGITPRTPPSPKVTPVATPTLSPTPTPRATPRTTRKTPKKVQRDRPPLKKPEFPWGILVGLGAAFAVALLVVFIKTRPRQPGPTGNTGELEL